MGVVCDSCEEVNFRYVLTHEIWRVHRCSVLRSAEGIEVMGNALREDTYVRPIHGDGEGIRCGALNSI
jgi:hypothetical protein